MLSLTATSIKRPTSPKLGRLNGNPPDFYVHPSLYLHHEPSSGNAAQARKPLQAGTLLLIDSAYASIPLVPPGSNNRPLCSRLQCSRKITRSASTVVCPKLCAHEVVWCNSECRRLSSAQHDYECAWLSTHSQNIREGCGERDFYMLWLVVRILASRHLEMRFPQSETSLENNSFTSSWDALCRLRSNEGTQQPLKLEYWRGLVREYLMGEGSMLPGSLNEDDMLTLMCREETNNFDLLPGLIGVWPLPSFEDRGEPYSWGMYLRAVFFNHACIPNVMHQPDDKGRIVYHATRDIAAHENLTIAYFDLAEYPDVKDRRAYLQRDYRFNCVCPRCLIESGEAERSAEDL